MEVKAKTRFIRMSHRKLQLVADLVRGRIIEDALSRLYFCNKRAAIPVRKVIESALANAKEQYGAITEKGEVIYIKDIQIGKGPIMYRIRPYARGRMKRIRHRLSHIFVTIDTHHPTPKEEKLLMRLGKRAIEVSEEKTKKKKLKKEKKEKEEKAKVKE